MPLVCLLKEKSEILLTDIFSKIPLGCI